jgi:NAD(P)-dependent dehydrogenase (short-subunit alcohol dehydrogenase family)
MRVCIVGASGKLGQYMVQHALDRGYEVVGVCRAESVEKLNAFKGRITVIPGATNDAEIIKRALSGCDGVLVVLVPRGVHGYSTGTAQAVLDHAPPGARLVFSSGWHITRDGQDVYSWKLKAIVKVFGPLARLARFADLDDQVEACRRVFASDTRWTVVRGSDLEEGESQGLPVWSRHVGDPFSRATSRAAWTLPCSWWRPSRTMSSSTRPRRSSAARRPRHSRTPPANELLSAPVFGNVPRPTWPTRRARP